MRLGAACQKGIHHRCPHKLGSGRVCECECHEANRNCWRCNGTGSYPDSLPEFVVCECVMAKRAKAKSSER